MDSFLTALAGMVKPIRCGNRNSPRLCPLFGRFCRRKFLSDKKLTAANTAAKKMRARERWTDARQETKHGQMGR